MNEENNLIELRINYRQLPALVRKKERRDQSTSSTKKRAGIRLRVTPPVCTCAKSADYGRLGFVW